MANFNQIIDLDDSEEEDLDYPLIIEPTDKNKGFILTKREAQCFMQAIENKSVYEIARNLGLRPKTVYFHLRNATVKMVR